MRTIERPGLSSRERFLLLILGVPVLLLVMLTTLVVLILPERRKDPDNLARGTLTVTSAWASAYFGDDGSYEFATPAHLSESEPGYSFVDRQSEVKLPTFVSVTATKTTFVAATRSKSGRCFFIMDSVLPGTRYAVANDRCAAANAPDPTSPLWGPTW
jgi:hypothetical protein